MLHVTYISSLNEIPAGQKHVLVIYGEEYAKTEHPLGLTITVARTVSQLSFLTTVHTARDIATHAGISEVFVCTAVTPGPNPTHSGMFTYVPARDELSSNVVGLNVYNKDNPPTVAIDLQCGVDPNVRPSVLPDRYDVTAWRAQRRRGNP